MFLPRISKPDPKLLQGMLSVPLLDKPDPKLLQGMLSVPLLSKPDPKLLQGMLSVPLLDSTFPDPFTVLPDLKRSVNSRSGRRNLRFLFVILPDPSILTR